jgi:hypothetical protein
VIRPLFASKIGAAWRPAGMALTRRASPRATSQVAAGDLTCSPRSDCQAPNGLGPYRGRPARRGIRGRRWWPHYQPIGTPGTGLAPTTRAEGESRQVALRSPLPGRNPPRNVSSPARAPKIECRWRNRFDIKKLCHLRVTKDALRASGSRLERGPVVTLLEIAHSREVVNQSGICSHGKNSCTRWLTPRASAGVRAAAASPGPACHPTRAAPPRPCRRLVLRPQSLTCRRGPANPDGGTGARAGRAPRARPCRPVALRRPGASPGAGRSAPGRRGCAGPASPATAPCTSPRS